MSTERFEDVLETTIGMLRAGVSIDDCARRFPDHALELRDHLAAAQTLYAGRAPAQPEPVAAALARRQLLEAAAKHEAAGPAPAFPLVSGPWRRPSLLPYAVPVAVAIVIFGGAALGVSAATGNGTPRDWFTTGSAQSQPDDDADDDNSGAGSAAGGDDDDITGPGSADDTGDDAADDTADDSAGPGVADDDTGDDAADDTGDDAADDTGDDAADDTADDTADDAGAADDDTADDDTADDSV